MPGAGAVRAIRDRIRSVQSTAKVTKAMQLVAASKMRRAQDRALQSRPYATQMRAVLAQLAGYAEGKEQESLHPLLRQRPVKHFAFIHITADRGLAGGLNANMNRAGAGLALGRSRDCISAAMPSCSSATLKPMPLSPVAPCTTVLAPSNACLKASTVLTSGLGAPFCTITHNPVRPAIMRVSATTLPCAINSSISFGLTKATSNASPAAIFFRHAAMLAISRRSLWPLARSNEGAIACSALRAAGLENIAISAICMETTAC
mgnify:CR=1 FL=1